MAEVFPNPLYIFTALVIISNIWHWLLYVFQAGLSQVGGGGEGVLGGVLFGNFC